MDVDFTKLHVLPHASGPATAPLDADQILLLQQSAWSRQECRPVEDWIRDYPQLAQSPDAILDLIYQEHLLRSAAGEKLDVEEYAARFPELALEIRRLFEVHRALAECSSIASSAGDPPTTSHDGSGGASRGLLRGLPRIAGYRIEGLLGRGGMGVVYRARQLAAHRDVALKVLLHGASATPAEVQRFRNEARSASRLDHPGIVSIYDVGAEGTLPYYSMTLVEGPTLKEELEAGPFEPKRAARLLVEIAEAVQYGHDQGVIHRDLKPANILISSDGRARIADFGLAKLLSDGSAGETLSGQVLGTPSYMAPEQARGVKEDVGPPVDVYALGALLYTMLTGRPPFLTANAAETMRQVCDEDPVPPRQRNPAIPADLETMALKCLEKLPGKRYATAAAVAEDLQRYLDGRPILARPLRFHHRCWRWSVRNPMTTALIAGVALVSFGALVQTLLHQRSLESLNATITAQNVDLQQSAERLSDALDESKKLEAQATASERRAQAMLHAAELQLAAKAWQKGDLREAGRILAEDAQRLPAGATPDFAWRYLNRQTSGPAGENAASGLHGALIDQDQQQLYYATFSPDGRWLATCGSKGWIRVYDSQKNYELVRQIDTDQIEVNSVGFNQDSTLLASAGDDGRVCLWSCPEGKLVRSVTVSPQSKVFGVAFVNDSARFVTCGTSNTVVLWDVNHDAPLHTWEVEANGIEAIAVRKGGQQDADDVIAMAAADGRVVVAQLNDQTYSPISYEESGTIPHKCIAIAYSGNQQYRVWGHAYGLVKVRDLWNDKSREFSRPDDIGAVAVRSDGTVICTDRGGIITVDSPGSKENRLGLQRTWSGGSPRIPGLAIAPDARHFITAGSNGEVRRWQIDAPHENSQYRLIPVPENQGPCPWGWNGQAYLDDPLRIVRIGERRQPAGRAVVTHALSASGDHAVWVGDHIASCCDARNGVLVVGTLGGTVLQLTDLDDRNPRTFPVFPADDVQDVRLFPGGDRALIHGGAGELRILDLNDGRTLASGQIDTEPCLSPDGLWIAAYEAVTHAVVIRDVPAFQVRRRCLGHLRPVHQLAFSADSKRLVSVGEDRTGIVWDVATGERLFALSGHLATIHDAAFSPDGRVLVTMDDGGAVKLWSAETGTELYDLARVGGSHRRMGFTPDGTRLIVSQQDGTLAVFDGAPVVVSE